MNTLDFVLDITLSVGRPTIVLDSGYTAMIDTGASVPVWTDEPDILVKTYKGVREKENCGCKWFGGKTHGDLYRIPCFKLGNIEYPQFPVLVIQNSEFPTTFIIPALAFAKLRVEFDFQGKNMTVLFPPGETSIRHLLAHVDDKNLITAQMPQI